MYKISRILQSLLELAIYRIIEKREVDNISNITINNLGIFVVSEIVLVLIYKVVGSYKYKL